MYFVAFKSWTAVFYNLSLLALKPGEKKIIHCNSFSDFMIFFPCWVPCSECLIGWLALRIWCHTQLVLWICTWCRHLQCTSHWHNTERNGFMPYSATFPDSLGCLCFTAVNWGTIDSLLLWELSRKSQLASNLSVNISLVSHSPIETTVPGLKVWHPFIAVHYNYPLNNW